MILFEITTTDGGGSGNATTTTTTTNLLDNDSTTGSSSKIICPLFNGHIHRITILSDLLATSQYIDGHKTATIAEIQLGPSTNAQINQMQIRDAFDWKNEHFFFTMGEHESQTAGGMTFVGNRDTTDDPEYLDTILPDVFTSFHCNNGVIGNYVQLVVMNQDSTTYKVTATPADNQHPKRTGNCHSI